MMKKSLYIFTLLAAFLALSSCSESEEVGEFDNWKERNQLYVDSIAHLANTSTDGWTKIVAFNLSEEVEKANPNNNHFVYIQKIENGAGETCPLYNDSIRVHYLGRLIPSSTYPQGYVFGKSYSTYTLNEATDVPTLLAVNQNVDGFATAVMRMVEGDVCKIVIPYYLGYGESGNSSGGVPGYSALIFDVKLARIYKYKIDTDTTWH